MTRRIDPSRWGGRVRLGLVVATAAFVVDQLTKLLAVGIGEAFVPLNSVTGLVWWLPLATFLLGVLIRSAWVAAALGLMLGGAAGNAFDWLVWPGGVPDFIHTGGSYYNLADFFIYAGLAGAVVFSGATGARFLHRRNERREVERYQAERTRAVQDAAARATKFASRPGSSGWRGTPWP